MTPGEGVLEAGHVTAAFGVGAEDPEYTEATLSTTEEAYLSALIAPPKVVTGSSRGGAGTVRQARIHKWYMKGSLIM